MFFKKYFLLFSMVIFSCLLLEGQEKSKYDLLTESYISRPLCMHKGQIQVNSGYEFSIINAIYDQEREKIDMTMDGTLSAKHQIPFELKFGLLENVQLSASTAYASLGIRNQNHHVISDEGKLYVFELNTYKGFNDLYFGTDLTAPFKGHLINWVISAGISLAVFNHEPDKPDHSYTIMDYASGLAKLEYKYNWKYASGVPKGFLGSSLKLRTGKISITGVFAYVTGMKSGESCDWNFRLVNNEFEYEKEEFRFHVGQTVDYRGEVAVQAFSWLTLWSAFSGYTSNGGWSDMTGKKIGTPEESLASLSLGFEILVSPSLRIEQQIVLPVSGKNVIAHVAFQTGLSLNFIPSFFHKKNTGL
jgi:hypothetical protein